MLRVTGRRDTCLKVWVEGVGLGPMVLIHLFITLMKSKFTWKALPGTRLCLILLLVTSEHNKGCFMLLTPPSLPEKRWVKKQGLIDNERSYHQFYSKSSVLSGAWHTQQLFVLPTTFYWLQKNKFLGQWHTPQYQMIILQRWPDNSHKYSLFLKAAELQVVFVCWMFSTTLI